MFNHIHNLLSEVSKGTRMQLKLDTNYLVLDNEIALYNSAKNSMNIENWKGCLFHFMQILWRRAGQEKLRTKERINLISTMITGLTLLVFIDKKQVTESFNKVKEYVLSKSQEFGYKNYLNYFESNWIKGHIPISTWNFYKESVNNFSEFKRTTNYDED